MHMPVVRGVIERRILANYRLDPEIAARLLPAPFRPQLVNGYAVGGICLIRLRALRPRFVPRGMGLRSENAAHRLAVEWDADGRTQSGVYVPRRDTDSRWNTWFGGRVFPGVHHRAAFRVRETADRISVEMESDDGRTRVAVVGAAGLRWPKASVFASVDSASQFFEQGAIGYSPARTSELYEGLELRCHQWHVQPLDVERVASSYFEDDSLFPRGSVAFDCALLMRGIEHEWHGREPLCRPVAVA